MNETGIIRYVGNGITSDYTFPFQIFSAQEILVYFNDTIQESGFTVSGVENISGGEVCFETPPADGLKITLKSNVYIERKSDFQEGGALRASVINREFNNIIAAIKQVNGLACRAPKLPISLSFENDLILPNPSAGKAILWNDAANGLENSVINFNELVSNVSANAQNAALSESNALTYQNNAQNLASLAANSADTASSAATAAQAALSSIELPTPVASTYLKRSDDNSVYETKSAADIVLDIGIPTISGSSDAGKVISVNSGGTAFELAALSSGGTIYGTCSTSGSTAAKTVSYDGFVLETGATINVVFSNANTATAPTLNVNSTGAASIALEDGTTTSSTYPAYFPAGAVITFVYDGSKWRFKNNIVKNYVSGTSWYRIWADGFKQQGGEVSIAHPTSSTGNLSFLISFKDTNYIGYVVSRTYSGTSAQANTIFIPDSSSAAWGGSGSSSSIACNWMAFGY